jgi:hypothetical protein
LTVVLTHGTPYGAKHGCNCFPCVDALRVYEALRVRIRVHGVVHIRHNGIVENRYPEAVVNWIKRGKKRDYVNDRDFEQNSQS